MIRVILTGGLGNQMFEYAAAKSLAMKLNKQLAIDTYALDKDTQGTKRKIELDVFDIDLSLSTSWKSCFLVKAYPLVDKNRGFFQKSFGYFRDHSAIVYAAEFEELRHNAILHGHFQNEKYFKSFEDEIRQEFVFKAPLVGKNKELSDVVNNINSVAIHVRRGDYLSNEQAKKNFAVCEREYYQQAIAKIKEAIGAPHFFVFAENFEWVEKNLIFDDSPVTYVDWNVGKDSYIDMQLMSLCKHTIIANSTFSWWAAWLNMNKNKLVIAPSQWFRDEIRNKDLVNFYPSNWTII